MKIKGKIKGFRKLFIKLFATKIKYKGPKIIEKKLFTNKLQFIYKIKRKGW